MRRSGKGSGGGEGMNKIVHKPVKGGAGPVGRNPANVGGIGVAKDPKGLEPRFTAARPNVPLGNTLVNNIGSGGPGAGRTVYACGSQAAPVRNPVMPKGKDQLADFGPDIPGRRG